MTAQTLYRNYSRRLKHVFRIIKGIFRIFVNTGLCLTSSQYETSALWSINSGTVFSGSFCIWLIVSWYEDLILVRYLCSEC
jgi:hypothetical protein